MASLPTIKQLRYLVELEKHQHFGHAAEACFVSQSAFSVAIRELESNLNVKLVDRTNRSITFTAIGRQITAQARLCLFDLEGLMDIANEQRDPLSGDLRLGAIPTIAPFMLPKILPGIRKSFPKLDLYLREEQTESLYEELTNGSLDVILIALPYELKNIQTMPLFEDRFLLATHKKSRLLDNPKDFRVNRLKPGEILLLEEGHCLRDHVLSAMKLKSQDRLNRFSATSLHTLVQMVDSDLGISFIPEMAKGSTLLKNTQVSLHEMSKSYVREIALAWRASSARGEEFTQLGKLMQQLMAS